MFPALVAALVLHTAPVSSYSAYSTTKAYDLQVPGSTPIRIIEADPVWDFVDIHDQPITEKYNRDLEHRTLRTVQQRQSSTTQHTKTTLGNPIGQDDLDYDDPDELANSSRLKDFLEKFSVNKVKSKLEHQDDHQQQEDASLEHVEIITKNPADIRDKSKAWNLNSPYHASDLNSFEKKKGWVSLEAVPWSVSKISKWHANNVKPAGFNDKLWTTDDYTYTPKPNVVTRPNGYNYDQQYQHQQESYRPPSFAKPTAVYAQKVHLEYTTNRNDKPWAGNNNNNNNNNYLRPAYTDYHHQHTDDCNHKNNRYANSYGDVVTDGQPPNFPETQQESTYNRRRGTSTSSEVAHVSHPFSGDGEWVLLSTTKGYKYPHRHNRERSMQFNSALNNPEDTNIVDAHKTVKLTVLPPAKGSRVNMTTSHGGLLQVESTFQTVDQAQKAYAKRQKIKQQKNKRRKPMAHKRKALMSSPTGDHQDRELSYSPEVSNYQSYRPTRSNGNDPETPDASTVLAAVGAGMIPATMALMVPMALNGRRRRRRRDLRAEGLPPGPGQMMLSYQDVTLPRSI